MLPIDAVRIDRHFLESGAAAAGDAAIFGAVIDVSRSIGLRVCADGVDTREQLELVERRGCQEAQGSYYGGAADPRSLELLMKPATLLQA